MNKKQEQRTAKDTLTGKLASKFTLAKSMAPEIPGQADGKLKKLFAAFKGNMTQMVSLNMLLMIFALPIIVVFFILLPNQETAAAAGYTLSGGLGIGFGITDQTLTAIESVYEKRQLFILCFLTPCMMVLSIGASGVYHCCRNLMWGSKVKTLKHFFRGIKLHFWKFLLTYTFMGLVGTSVGYSLVEVQTQIALNGAASPGVWVWLVFSSLLALLTVMYMLIFQSNMISYKLKYRNILKNSMILAIILFITTLMLAVGLCIPFLLLFISLLKFIIYILLLVIGGIFLVMCNVAYGQYASENFVDMLYEYEIQSKIKSQKAEKEKEKKASNKNKKVVPPYKKKKK